MESFCIKSKKSYKCPKCKKKSDIILKNIIIKSFFVVQLISLIIFSIVVFLGCGYCVLAMALITLMFLSFFLISPYAIILKPKIEDSDGTIDTRYDEISSNTTEENTDEKEIFSN